MKRQKYKLPAFPILCVSEPCFVPLRKDAAESEATILEDWKTEKRTVGVKRQFAEMPEWECSFKQHILLIYMKLSLNNAARSPLTPLDLRFASASSKSRGNQFVSPSVP